MSRTARTAVIALTASLFAAGVFGLVAQLVEPPDANQTRAAQFLYLLNPIITAVLSCYLVVVRPRHPAGWLTMLISFAATIDSLAKAAIDARPGAVGVLAREWAVWLDNWVWVLLFAGICFLILTYPTGRLVGRRWRGVAIYTVVAVVAEVFLCAVSKANSDYKGVLPVVQGFVPESVANVGFVAVFAALVAALASLIVRRRAYRRTGDVTGIAQLRWLVWAAGIVVVSLVVSAAVDGLVGSKSSAAAIVDFVNQVGFYGFPLAIVVAITRHGLFEIDKVISRTVSYLVITGLLLGTYIGIIAAFSSFLPNNPLVVAGATLTVAALFVPVRRNVQTRVDRRFNRSKYNRALLVERFAEGLRRDVTHGSDGDDLLTAVGSALQPTHAGLWLAPS
ncbi:hypothetical protein [uncultured Jatrophihabitans sp.]|uniref:hypothetical protein n=1 Tax=uncultured Jatrophihabitans sp. TaxID=1610747 RepID=UPI0035CC65B3